MENNLNTQQEISSYGHDIRLCQEVSERFSSERKSTSFWPRLWTCDKSKAHHATGSQVGSQDAFWESRQMMWWAEGAHGIRRARFTTSIELILFSPCNRDLRENLRHFKYFCSLNILIFAQRRHLSLLKMLKSKEWCVCVRLDPSLGDGFLWQLMEKPDLYKLPCYTVAFTQHRHLIFIMCPWWGHSNLWQTCCGGRYTTCHARLSLWVKHAMLRNNTVERTPSVSILQPLSHWWSIDGQLIDKLKILLRSWIWINRFGLLYK